MEDCSDDDRANPRRLPRDIVSDGMPGGGGLCSWVGEVEWDCTGVVYSEELAEISLLGLPPPLNLLIVVCITRRASKVEEKGSPSSSSEALEILSKMARRGSILLCATLRKGGDRQ